MNEGRAPGKAVYIDARSVRVVLDGDAWRIRGLDKADQLVPLRRVDRAVVRNVDEGLMRALLALVEREGTVHFQDGRGTTFAVLQDTRPTSPRWVREWVSMIEEQSGCAPFHWWADVQQRHVWSRVFRRGRPGDYAANRALIVGYIQHYRPDVLVSHEVSELEQLLRAWLQADLNRQGLRPVVEVLRHKECDLVGVLHRCMMLTLLWKYACWRRQKTVAAALPCRDITAFFELQAVAGLRDQLERHISVLHEECRARGKRGHGEGGRLHARK